MDVPIIEMATTGQAVEIPLPAHFTDEDGETLEFRANSLDSKLVDAALTEDGQSLRITARANGLGQVRVVAYDAMGASVRGEVSVLVRPRSEKMTILEGNSFSSQLTILAADKPSPTTIRLVSSTGTVSAEAAGEFSAFEPVVLETGRLAPGLYVLFVDIAGQTYRRTLVKK